MLILIYTIVALIAIYIFNYYRMVKRYPEGPIPWPFIGNLFQVNHKSLHTYLADLSREYGPIYTIFMPSPTIVINDYEYLKEAYVKQGEIFAGRTNRPPDNLLQKYEQTGVLSSDGEVWREQRRTSLKILRDFGLGKKIMEQQIIGSVREMLAQLHDTRDKSRIDLYLPIQLCVGNVINELLFGYHYHYNNAQKFADFVALLTRHVVLKRGSPYLHLVQMYPWLRYLPYIGYKGYYAVRDNIDSYQTFMEKEVEEQMAKYDPFHEPENFVHAYLREMESSKGPSSLSKANLIATCIDFWMAGMETTSITLRWAIIYMLENSGVQEKVRAEIMKQIGVDRLPEMADRQNMPYTQAVLHETQRFANLVAVPPAHRCTEETILIDKCIPKDTFVYTPLGSIMSDPKVFNEPEKFIPERYLNEDGVTFNKTLLDRTIPFGMGKRTCAGEGLARMELFLILTSLLQNYEINKIESIDTEPIYGTVLHPKRFNVEIVPINNNKL